MSVVNQAFSTKGSQIQSLCPTQEPLDEESRQTIHFSPLIDLHIVKVGGEKKRAKGKPILA